MQTYELTAYFSDDSTMEFDDSDCSGEASRGWAAFKEWFHGNDPNPTYLIKLDDGREVGLTRGYVVAYEITPR